MPAGSEVGRQSSDPSYGIYAYTAREWDPETNLYFYRARYYDPRVGRFLSEDPSGSRARASAGVPRPRMLLISVNPAWSDENLYAYVGGNPVRYIDAFGLSRTGWPASPPSDAINCPGLCGWGYSHADFSNTGYLPDGRPTNKCVYWVKYYDCNCRLIKREILIKCDQIDFPCGRKEA
jgi:RHS repeat-associated protein